MSRTFLFIAGIAGSAYLLPPVAAELEKRGWRVVVYEHGDPRAGDELLSLEEMAERALRLLDDAGAAQATVCGESFGGAVAQVLARRHPDRVSRLILAGTFARLPFARRRAMLRAVAPAALALSPLVPAAAVRLAKRIYNPSVARDEPEALRRAVRREPIPPLRSYVRKALLALDFDSRPWLAELRMPVLVVHGDADRLIPPACSYELARGLPECAVAVMPGGHLSHYGRPDLFLRALDRFLPGKDRGSAGIPGE